MTGLVTAMSADAASLATKALEAVAGSTPRANKNAGGSNPFASGESRTSAHPPPPLELLACTAHVFVFGDLNYRVDPGAVTGTGWGTAWKNRTTRRADPSPPPSRGWRTKRRNVATPPPRSPREN